MYKKLRYGLIALLAFVGLTASAQGVTFDFDNDYATLFPTITGLSTLENGDGDIISAVTAKKDGFSITVSAKDPSAGEDVQPNRLWDGTPRLRVYSGTITISGSSIETIKFNWKNRFDLSTTTGSLKEDVWIGNASEVVFNILGNTQISSIEINGEVTIPTKTEDDLDHGTEDSPLTVTAAIEAAEVIGNKNSKNYFYVCGEISSVKYYFDAEHGTATYWIKSADPSETREFQIYSGRYFNNQSWKEGDKQIEVGNTVIVYGKIKNHNNNTPELVSGYLVALISGEEEEAEIVDANVEDFIAAEESTDVWYRMTGRVRNFKDSDQWGNFDLEDQTGYVYVRGLLSEKGGKEQQFQELVAQEGIKEGTYVTIVGHRGSYNGKIQVNGAYFESAEAGDDPVTYVVSVAEALETVGQQAAGLPSFDDYEITGFVVGTPNYYNGKDDAFTGGVDVYIADTKGGEPTFFIYHAWGLNDEKFTEDGDLNLFEEGDKVTFVGKLLKYIDDENVETLELKNGYLISVEGTPDEVSVVIPSSGVATFCTPYAIEIEDQNVYIVSAINDDKTKAALKKLESGTIVAGGVGLLVEGEGTVEFTVSDDNGTIPEGNLLVGTLKDTYVSMGTVWVLYEGAFCQTENGTIPAGKAYLEIPGADAGAKIFIDFSGMTTAISEVKAQNESSEIYTIGGIRVKNAQQKGIYIINGKKVVK